MKKNILLSVLALATLGLVACGGGEGGNGGADGTLVASYDLSQVSGVWGEGNGIYWGPKDADDSAAFNETFVNTVEGGVTATWTKTAKGVEKAQLTQGPKCGGVKLNGKNEPATSITFTLGEGQSVDKVVLDVRSWVNGEGAADPITVKFGEADAVTKDGDPEKGVEFVHEATDMNTLTIAAPKNAEGATNRWVITSIKMYTK